MRLSFILLALCALSACQSMSGGAPAGQAQVIVRDVIRPQIEGKAEEVFYRYGFSFKGAAEDKMEFERNGGVMDNILYGNWQENDTTTRVTLYIITKEPGVYALRTRSIIERNTFGGASNTKLFDVQGSRYRAILDKIAKELAAENAPAQG